MQGPLFPFVLFVTFVVQPDPEQSEGKIRFTFLHHEEHEGHEDEDLGIGFRPSVFRCLNLRRTSRCYLSLCSLDNLRSPSTSMSVPEGGHLAALAKHHVEPLLGRQGRQVIQLELDFRTLVVSRQFQHRHRIHLDRLDHAVVDRQAHSIAFSSLRQAADPQGRRKRRAGTGACPYEDRYGSRVTRHGSRPALRPVTSSRQRCPLGLRWPFHRGRRRWCPFAFPRAGRSSCRRRWCGRGRSPCPGRP